VKSKMKPLTRNEIAEMKVILEKAGYSVRRKPKPKAKARGLASPETVKKWREWKPLTTDGRKCRAGWMRLHKLNAKLSPEYVAFIKGTDSLTREYLARRTGRPCIQGKAIKTYKELMAEERAKRISAW
jgi:hypothetical protein